MGLFNFSKKQSVPNLNVSITATPTFENQINVQANNNRLLDENSIRSRNGLKVSEILLLYYCTQGKYPNPQGGYPNFWWVDYGINDVGQVLNSLKQKGFIRFSTPFEMLESLKVGQLKEILSKLDQPTKGKKDELIERITAVDNPSILNGYIKSLKYTLTDLGEQELKESEYVPYMHSHKNLGLTVWDMNKLVNKQRRPFRDILWGHFNQQIPKFKIPADAGLYRNHIYTMGEFVFEEGRYNDALRFYSWVCYYDVLYYNGYSGFDNVADLLIPGILKRIKECKDKLGVDNNALNQLLLQHFSYLNGYGCSIQISNPDLAKVIVSKMYNEFEQ